MDEQATTTVSTEVLEKMAELAACEIDGVAGVSKRAVDLKDAIKNKSAFKGVKVENINGAVYINVYLKVVKNVNVHAVAEAVQQNVKDRIQTMTGTAVTKVNVTVADIDLPKETQNVQN